MTEGLPVELLAATHHDVQEKVQVQDTVGTRSASRRGGGFLGGLQGLIVLININGWGYNVGYRAEELVPLCKQPGLASALVLACLAPKEVDNPRRRSHRV